MGPLAAKGQNASGRRSPSDYPLEACGLLLRRRSTVVTTIGVRSW